MCVYIYVCVIICVCICICAFHYTSVTLRSVKRRMIEMRESPLFRRIYVTDNSQQRYERTKMEINFFSPTLCSAIFVLTANEFHTENSLRIVRMDAPDSRSAAKSSDVSHA